MKIGAILILAAGMILWAGCSLPAAGTRDGMEGLSRLRVEVTALEPGLGARRWVVEHNAGYISSNEYKNSAALTTEALQLRAIHFLREHAPELNTHGPADDWTLKVQLYWQYENLPVTAAAIPGRWVMSDVRVIRPMVVDGRKVLAVVYEGSRAGPERDPSLAAHQEPYPGRMEEALDGRLEEFVAAWRKANRGCPTR